MALPSSSVVIGMSSMGIVIYVGLNTVVLGSATVISSRLEFSAAAVACSASVGLSSSSAGLDTILSELRPMPGIYAELSG